MQVEAPQGHEADETEGLTPFDCLKDTHARLVRLEAELLPLLRAARAHPAIQAFLRLQG